MCFKKIPAKISNVILWLIIGLYPSLLSAQNSSLRFRHLTVDNGLSHTDATAILQDAKGFIWIGTYSGLNRYDGHTTKVYYNTTDGNQTAYLNRITDMHLGANNIIWLATEGGIAKFSPSQSGFVSMKPADAVTAAAAKKPLQKILTSGRQLFTVSLKEVSIYKVNEDNSLQYSKSPLVITQGIIYNMVKDAAGNVWVAYAGGLACIAPNGNIKKIVLEDAAANMVTALRFNNAGQLAVCNQKGIFIFPQAKTNGILKNPAAEVTVSSDALISLVKYPANIAQPNNMAYDSKGDVWLSTVNGACKYVVKESKFETYRFNEFEKNSITANSLNSVFIDKSDCLWLTSFGGGVNIANLNQKPFYLLQRIPGNTATLSANYTRALLEDAKGNLWIGTRSNGLNYYDFTTSTYTQFHPGNSSLQNDNIRSLLNDNAGRLWIGTDVGISIKHPAGNFENLRPGTGSGDGFATGNYFALAQDKFNQVWAGSWNSGLSRIIYNGNGSYYVERITAEKKQNPILSNRVTFIYADKTKPELLVGTDHGLNHIFLNADGSIATVKDYSKGKNNSALSSSFVWPVVRQADSVIWVGTLGGGLNKIRLSKDGSFEIIHIKDNSSQELKDIESMLMDDNGTLWLAGKMLAAYNPAQNSFVYYDVNDGLQGNSFKIGAAYKSATGRLYFGGINGVNYFNPAAIASGKVPPAVAFTELLVNGEKVENKEGNGNFETHISYLDKLKLSSSQNNFSVQFSAMHYANPEQCKFRYKLEGYDKNWIYTDASNRYATYSNLDYGNYKLKVEAANSDGVWTGKFQQLSITLLAPWWKTTVAKLFYILLLAGIIYIIWRYQHSWFALKRKIQYKEMEERKSEELHQMKLQFFTNISHEFRTPLTLILGPTEKMLHNETKKEEQHNYLRLIYSNARRLLGLTNELMDFRKVETNSMALQVSEGDLNKFVDSISAEFRELAVEKNMVYNVKQTPEQQQVYFDPNIMEKILVNLIANAFKYTDNNGMIEIEVLESMQSFKPKFSNHVVIPSPVKANDMVWVRVADSGIGITDNSIENIFDSYFRVNTIGREKHLGTGIGLALVKSLAELHKGELHVYSERNEGTEILFGFPAGKQNYKGIEISTDTDYRIDFESLQYTINWIDDEQKTDKTTETKKQQKKNGDVKKRVLVVEDNTEMRRFLVDSLSDTYEVLQAGNGVEGLKVAKEYFPDLIISDLMMPEMDGIAFCKAIRQDVDTSHISFILITAKSSMDTHLEGLECGADTYFPKPFSLRLLQVTISNLFEQRDKLKTKYSQDVFAEARELVNNDRDKEFLDELIGIIEENMELEELDVEMICRKIGMSRTKLYGKVKAVTGQAIGEFTRILRLKKAAKILVSEDVSIQEVMFRVGIQSQSYFTKAFKKEFGKTPSYFVAEYSKKGKSTPLSDGEGQNEQSG